MGYVEQVDVNHKRNKEMIPHVMCEKYLRQPKFIFQKPQGIFPFR
jgi:hypothetical protein